MRKRMAKTFIKLLFAALAPLLAACSNDYVNVIPEGSIALASLNMAQSNSINSPLLSQLSAALGNTDSGIDFAETVYAFETSDGSLGLVARVGDGDKLEQWFTQQSTKGYCTEPKERKGCKFAVVKGSFVAGFTSDALLVMGPTVATEQSQLQLKMSKMLKADDDRIRQSPLFQRLDSMAGPLNIVAQAQALPNKLTAPLTLGAPKGTSPSDVCVAASISASGDGVVGITGETFSFNPQIDKALKAAAAQYRPISTKYVNAMQANALLSMVCSVDGNTFIQQLRNNDTFRSLLIGLNTALDLDMMLKSIKGDMLMTIPYANDKKMSFQMVADAPDANWLSDVDYWKKSCPKGTTITDWNGHKSFHFASEDYNMYFGHKDNGQIFFGSDENLALSAGAPATKQLSNSVINTIKGKRLCLVIGVEGLAKAQPEAQSALNMLAPWLGNVKTIVYSVK